MDEPGQHFSESSGDRLKVDFLCRVIFTCVCALTLKLSEF